MIQTTGLTKRYGRVPAGGGGDPGIPAGPIYSVPEALGDPHALARGMVQEIEHPGGGRVKALGNPVKLSRSPATLRKNAPRLGEDTDAVLREAGYTTDALEVLRAAGAVR